MKFVEELDKVLIRSFCMQNKLCTNMNYDEYEIMLNLFDNSTNIKENIPILASKIYKSSNKEKTEKEISSELFATCCIRYVE